MLNWYMLAGAMEALGRKPDECEFIETWIVQLQQVLRGVQAMTTPGTNGTTTTGATGAIPRLTGDIRPLIPKLGLRNYWYPAVDDRKVGVRKPMKVALLGEEICLFRGATGASRRSRTSARIAARG